MSLKAATVIAIVGAALSVVLAIANLLARFINPLRETLYAGQGIAIGLLYTAVSATYLVFFITLSTKQK